ncbi:MAG: glycoside hydrolase family 28 protein [Nibricoccus sp.]
MKLPSVSYSRFNKSVFGATLLLGATCLTAWTKVNESLIPAADNVGAAMMPAEIAAISAPFLMPPLTRPRFPSLRVVVVLGATEELATRAIQAAIDEVSAKNGGTVILSKGVWKTGRLSLKSNVNLHLESGAELQFSGRVEDYQPAVFTRTEGVEVFSLGALIYANGQENISLTGQGRLIGPPLDSPMRKQKNRVSVDKIDARQPVVERRCDGRGGGPVYLPVFFGPINCRNVLVEGLTFEQSALWNIVPQYCDRVIIRGVTVESEKIPSGDGIDVDSSRNVLIEYCTFSCGDDCVVIKAGRGEDALRVDKSSEFIVMRNCLVRKGHAGISTGSETGGMIRNLYVCDSVFQEPVVGIRLKTRRPRAGGGEKLYYERIRIGQCSTAIAWDMLGESKFVGEEASRLPERAVTKLTPVYRDVTIKQVLAEKARFAIKVIGIPESPAANIVIEDVTATTTERPIILNDVDGFALRNADIKSANDTIGFLDARKVVFENCRFDTTTGQLNLDVAGERSREIEFRNCTPTPRQ